MKVVDSHFGKNATAAESTADGAMKWLIPPVELRGHGPLDARDYWDLRHGRLQYENVYSVTEDPGLRTKLVEMLRAAVGPVVPSKVLVPGCGSRALLEQDLVDSFPKTWVLATDYPGVAAAATAVPRSCVVEVK